MPGTALHHLPPEGGQDTEGRQVAGGMIQRLKGQWIRIVTAHRVAAGAGDSTCHLDQAVETAHGIGAPTTWLVHIAHQVGHKQGEAHTPDSVRLAWDGLALG